jgi:hypothetical protein
MAGPIVTRQDLQAMYGKTFAAPRSPITLVAGQFANKTGRIANRREVA